MSTKRTGIIKLLRKRSFLVVNLGLVFLVGWGFVGEFMRNASVQEEINRLQMQVDQLDGRNMELGKLTQRYSGSAMLEREARLKLNLKKPGEEVVVIRDTNPSMLVKSETRERSQIVEDEPVGSELEQQSTNIQKWVNHFFPNILDN